jgi:LysM repeat protein
LKLAFLRLPRRCLLANLSSVLLASSRTDRRFTFDLEVGRAGFYCRRMKRISYWLAAMALCGTPVMRAQDAATEERLNKLSGQIESVIETQQELGKRMAGLAKEVESLREQIGKPTGNYASQQDVEILKEKVKEVDRKRMEDAEKVRTELLGIRNGLLKTSGPTPSGKKKAATLAQDPLVSDKPEQGFEHVVQSGDTLSTIAQAYKEKNVKVSVEQIKKANPGLVETKMKVGQKIWIPAPKQ